MGRFLTTKFAKLIDTRSSIDNTLYGSGRAVGKSGILLQIEKASEASGDLTCYVFTKSIINTNNFVSITNYKEHAYLCKYLHNIQHFLDYTKNQHKF